MGRRILNDALRAIVNAEKRSKASVELRPVSTTMSSFLKIMKERVVLMEYKKKPHMLFHSTTSCPVFVKKFNLVKLIWSQEYKDFHVYDPHRVGRITVELQGRVKDCRALTYRQDIKAKEIEEYRLRVLPTHQWGYVVITTPDGVLDHEEAVKRNVGGQVLGYFH